MHIALISTTCVPVPPPRYGGTELIIAELARELVALGHRVTTFATGDSTPAGDLCSLFPRAMWPPDPYTDLAHVHYAFRELRHRLQRVDIVHAHTAVALPFAHFIDAPVVYTVHHHRVERLTEFYRYFAEVAYVMISRRQSELHPDVLNRCVVHHGLDPGRFRLGEGDGGYVAFLGRFAPEKGPHVAIDAARMAGVAIKLGGEAHWSDREYFKTEVEPRLALPGVEWIGEADHAKKQTLLGGARALLFPIDWEEPFGLVMIESMLCGTPVIAFRRGSVPEVVEDGVTGFIVDDPAQMAAAIARAASLDRAAVRRRAEERWSAARMARQYLDVYTECARRYRTARTTASHELRPFPWAERR